MLNDLDSLRESIGKVVIMLRRRKSSTIRKILKYSKLSTKNDRNTKSKTRTILRSMSEGQLNVLLQSLQNNGGIDTECIHTTLRRNVQEPDFVMALSFRYPDLTSSCSLRKSYCCCQLNKCADTRPCLNPYHYSMVIFTESPLPPYCAEEAVSRPSVQRTDRNDSSSSSTASTSKSLNSYSSYSGTHLQVQPPWCRISYWELKSRIGRMFYARQNHVNVFENIPQGDGLCLGLLDAGEITRTESSLKVRDTIGYGFQLTREADGVWLYNRSNIVLFTSSPTIQNESVSVQHPVVKRLPPGCSVLVLDPAYLPDITEKTKINGQSSTCIKPDLSEDAESYYSSQSYPYCVRVSFGKGWGLNYTRMSVTQCPCWVEMYLNIPSS